MQPSRVGVVAAMAAVVLAMSLTGCSRDVTDRRAAAQPFSRSEADAIIRVTANKNFTYGGFPASVRGPKVFLELRNDDPLAQHELQVLRSADVKGMGGIPPISPGQTRQVALELLPGRYFARCMIRAADTPHADLGMVSAFEVT